VRTRNLSLLAVVVAVSVIAGTTVVATHHGSFLGLGRQSGSTTPTPSPTVTQPPPPPVAAVGRGSAQSAAQPRSRRATLPVVVAKGRTVSTTGASGRAYPGLVTCPDTSVPSPNPYAWQCTHADGTPVRWSTNAITVWVDGLTPTQTTALVAAEAQWTPHTEISFVPAPSASAAQVVITEVESLDALPDLGPNVVEYAVTEVHQTGGYYDHATMQVANAPFLDADTWLDTLLHELGHVAGLAHVLSPDQIMRRVVGLPQTSYGDGDIAGLESERPSSA
jgi:hypothetical protein